MKVSQLNVATDSIYAWAGYNVSSAGPQTWSRCGLRRQARLAQLKPVFLLAPAHIMRAMTR